MAGPLIGNSVAFGEVTEAIAMVAPVDSAVLLLGETGTGKEVIARAIHDAGPRRHQRFVAVNCAAIPSACSKANCSVTSEAHSQARSHRPSDDFRLQTAARCSWTKSATCRWNCNPNCSERSRSSRWSDWAAAAARRRWTCE